MNEEPVHKLANLAVKDEQVFDADDIRHLAALLNELMEVDFYLNRPRSEDSDD